MLLLMRLRGVLGLPKVYSRRPFLGCISDVHLRSVFQRLIPEVYLRGSLRRCINEVKVHFRGLFWISIFDVPHVGYYLASFPVCIPAVHFWGVLMRFIYSRFIRGLQIWGVFHRFILRRISEVHFLRCINESYFRCVLMRFIFDVY